MQGSSFGFPDYSKGETIISGMTANPKITVQRNGWYSILTYGSNNLTSDDYYKNAYSSVSVNGKTVCSDDFGISHASIQWLIPVSKGDIVIAGPYVYKLIFFPVK